MRARWRFAKTLASTVLLWTAISALGALQTYSDNLRGGVGSHYPTLFVTWFIEYAVPLIVLSTGLSLALTRWPALIGRPRNVVALLAGLVLVFQPTQWLYMAWLRGYLQIGSLAGLRDLLLKMLLVGWFSTSATFAAILAIHYWRHARERELALQEQRMLALRHDLDCREGPSDITLSFTQDGETLSIRVTNPAGAGATPNPGTGLGLANTRDRLRLMHPAASLQAGLQEDRFVAVVRLPLTM